MLLRFCTIVFRVFTLRVVMLLTGVLLLAGLARADNLPQQAVVRIASDEWCPYVCVDNGQISGGYLIEATTTALQLAGYRVETVLMPFTRAINETRTGNIQGVVAAPRDQRLKPALPLIYSRSCFYTRRDQAWTYQGVASLNAITLGVISDYYYDYSALDEYIDQHRNNKRLVDLAYGEFAGEVNLKKLLAGRFAALLEDEAVMGLMVRKQRAVDQIRQAGCADGVVPVTVSFGVGDAHSDELVKALNAGMQQLAASGKLAMLRQRYQIPNNMPAR